MPLDYAALLRLVFPPSADEQQWLQLPDGSLLPYLQPTTHRETTTLLPYQNPYVRAAIHLNKFHHHAAALDALAVCVTAYVLSAELTEHVFIPVPLSRQRYQDRKYNQVSEVLYRARRLERTLTIDDRALFRTRDTAPQTSLTRRARKQNLRDAFAPRRRQTLTGRHVILVDDVLTTGATLTAATSALETCHPASIQRLAFAH